MGKYQLRLCEHCHKGFLAGNRYKGNVCPDCKRKMSTGFTVSHCLNCDKEFVGYHKNQRFCCERCRHHYKYSEQFLYRKRCANIECNNEFLGDKRSRYCSKECYRACRTNRDLKRIKGPEDYISTEPVEVNHARD